MGRSSAADTNRCRNACSGEIEATVLWYPPEKTSPTRKQDKTKALHSCGRGMRSPGLSLASLVPSETTSRRNVPDNSASAAALKSRQAAKPVKCRGAKFNSAITAFTKTYAPISGLPTIRQGTRLLSSIPLLRRNSVRKQGRAFFICFVKDAGRSKERCRQDP